MKTFVRAHLCVTFPLICLATVSPLADMINTRLPSGLAMTYHPKQTTTQQIQVSCHCQYEYYHDCRWRRGFRSGGVVDKGSPSDSCSSPELCASSTTNTPSRLDELGSSEQRSCLTSTSTASLEIRCCVSIWNFATDEGYREDTTRHLS